MSEIVYALFPDVTMAEKAVGAVLDHGIGEDQISLVVSELHTSPEAPDDPERRAKSGITTTTGADAASGAVKGAGIGLGVGVLAGLASLFIPGIGLVIGAGSLAAALSGVAGSTAAGAIVGGVAGFLRDQGVPWGVSLEYSKGLSRGGAMIAVTLPPGETHQVFVRQILSKYQAVDFHTYSSP